MRTIRIAAEKAPYLLIARGDRFAVVERRNGRLYKLHCGTRDAMPMTDEGAATIVGNTWCDESRARQIFSDVVTRYTELAERMR
jgi:hypothetical protein